MFLIVSHAQEPEAALACVVGVEARGESAVVGGPRWRSSFCLHLSGYRYRRVFGSNTYFRAGPLRAPILAKKRSG